MNLRERIAGIVDFAMFSLRNNPDLYNTDEDSYKHADKILSLLDDKWVVEEECNICAGFGETEYRMAESTSGVGHRTCAHCIGVGKITRPLSEALQDEGFREGVLKRKVPMSQQEREVINE